MIHAAAAGVESGHSPAFLLDSAAVGSKSAFTNNPRCTMPAWLIINLLVSMLANCWCKITIIPDCLAHVTDHRFWILNEKKKPRGPRGFTLLLQRESTWTGAVVFVFGNISYGNLVFAVVNTACSHLDFSECLASFVSHVSFSPKAFGICCHFWYGV